MFSIPAILPTLTNHMCQWSANDGTGLRKTGMQAECHVEVSCVNLNVLSIQCWNLCRKLIQYSYRPSPGSFLRGGNLARISIIGAHVEKVDLQVLG